MSVPASHARSLGSMPDASDWSFSRTAPAPPAPPSRPNGAAPPAATAGSAAAAWAPGARRPQGEQPQPGSNQGAPDKGGSGDRKRMILRAALIGGSVLVVAGLLVAIYFVLNSGGDTNGDLSGYSGVPADYVPTEVSDRDVRTRAPVLDEAAKRFTSTPGLEGANFEVATGMVPKGPREPPASIVIVLGGSGADGVVNSFVDDNAVLEDTTVDADGTDVRLVRIDDDNFDEVWTAIASPRDDIAVVAMSFTGGRQAAEDMARAALERGKQ